MNKGSEDEGSPLNGEPSENANGELMDVDENEPILENSNDEIKAPKVVLKRKSTFYLAQAGSFVEGYAFEAQVPGEDVKNAAHLSLKDFVDLLCSGGNDGQKTSCKKIGPSKGSPRPRPWGHGIPGLPGCGGIGDGPPDPPPSSKLSFDDCGGLEKQISFLKCALIGPLQGKDTTYARFGLKPPKGILFYGPPGTGKTRLAQAVANEIQKAMKNRVHFIYRKGQDIASKYFGQSSENLREVFQEAIDNQPTVLFFDELDGLAPTRDHTHLSQANVTIVTTMLGLMDELINGQVFVVGATNRIDSVDPALRRPGRFDKYLEFSPPCEKGRQDILKIHTKAWKVKPTESLLKFLSEKTVGFSGADLAKLSLDAFDNALSRLLAASKESYGNTDFSGLAVQKKDWLDAWEKMKPTNSAAFGSTLYTNPTGLDEHLEVLLSASVDKVANAIKATLEGIKAGKKAKVNALYVFAMFGGVGGGVDEFLIAPALKSGIVGDVPIYNYSSDSLSLVNKNGWVQQTNSTFNQAMEAPPPAILYIKDPQELAQVIKSNGYTTVLSLPQMIEKLRGKSVLLLAGGSLHPLQFENDNPFKNLLASNPIAAIPSPSDEERQNFFDQLFTEIMLTSGREWTDDEQMDLWNIQEELVDCTDEKEIGSLILLHDRLLEAVLKIPQENDTGNKAIIKALWEVIGAYKAMNS